MNWTAKALVERLRGYIEIDECEGGNPLVIEAETAAANMLEQYAAHLRRYGGHAKDCRRPRGPECDCGWDELKASLL